MNQGRDEIKLKSKSKKEAGKQREESRGSRC